MPDDGALHRFATSLRGRLIRPDDDGYDDARAVWNAAIDRRPAAIARCADTDDVRRAIEFARTHDLPLAVRGGGHGFAGKAVCEGGVVIDLSPMKDVAVDERRRVARVAGGCTLADLDGAAQRVGLATTMGTVSATGVAGLTLGGGLGWIMGKHGLACDNLVAAEVVTADGRRLRTSGDEHPDLIWGLRGGGGNFGVVTAFEFRLHPLTTVYGGAVTYPDSEARQVLRRYRDFALAAPDELTTYAGLQPLATGPAFSVTACWSGDPGRGEAALAPLRSFGTVIDDSLRAMPYLEMQQLLAPPPMRVASYARSSFLRALDDAAIDTMVACAETPPPALALWFLEPVHGAVTRSRDSAFSHRTPGFSFAVIAVWFEPPDADRSAAWVRGFSDAMSPHFGSGVYSNYLADGEDSRARAAYGGAYERLVSVKRTYDPANVFRLNLNVDPSRG
jgi:FAD/FMN-containing dehydrogenase